MTYQEFLVINTKVKQNKDLVGVHIEKYSASRNGCCILRSNSNLKVQAVPIAVSVVVNNVLNGAYYLENPSLVKTWKGFDFTNLEIVDEIEKFTQFMGNQNTVLIRNSKEFDKFVKWLKHHNVECILGSKANTHEFSYWQHIATINHKNPNVFLFEYRADKGLSWGDNIADSKEWYGKDPIVL